jgi:hypothetical protein
MDGVAKTMYPSKLHSHGTVSQFVLALLTAPSFDIHVKGGRQSVFAKCSGGKIGLGPGPVNGQKDYVRFQLRVLFTICFAIWERTLRVPVAASASDSSSVAAGEQSEKDINFIHTCLKQFDAKILHFVVAMLMSGFLGAAECDLSVGAADAPEAALVVGSSDAMLCDESTDKAPAAAAAAVAAAAAASSTTTPRRGRPSRKRPHSEVGSVAPHSGRRHKGRPCVSADDVGALADTIDKLVRRARALPRARSSCADGWPHSTRIRSSPPFLCR